MRLKANTGIFHSISMVLIGALFLVLPLAGCYDSSMKDLIKLENITPEFPFNGNPIPGNGGIITTSDISMTSVSLSWDKATDDVTPQNELQYLVYYSTFNTMQTVADIEKYGTPFGTWTTDIAAMDVAGLEPSTNYYFNVLVVDQEGEKASYEMVSATTGSTLILFSAGLYRGNLAPMTTASVRKDVDNLCSASPTYKTLSCKRVRAFISVSSTDSIANMPFNFGIPTNRTVQGPTGITIAASWASLFNNLLVALQDAGIALGFWWSGSLKNGAYDTVNNCGGWMDGTNASKGVIGAHNDNTFPAWLSRDNRNCNNTQEVLCLCW